MEEKDLSKVLEECKGYAKRGYSIATEQEKNLRTTLGSTTVNGCSFTNKHICSIMLSNSIRGEPV